MRFYIIPENFIEFPSDTGLLLFFMPLRAIVHSFDCLILFFTSHQQSFSYVGMGLPRLNQY